MITTAVILAAGTGSRFGSYTEMIPKGFVPVDGKTMIERSLDLLIKSGINRVIIGTGYKHEKYEALSKLYPIIECCYSPRYAITNSMYTLYNCREMVGSDSFLLLESDLIYERRALRSLLDSKAPTTMLVASLTKFQDQYYVAYDENMLLTNCSVDKDKLTPKGELVGIHKLDNAFYQQMCDDYATHIETAPKLGYEYQLLRMSQHISPVYVVYEEGLKWYEIDDVSDLKYAEEHIALYCK